MRKVASGLKRLMSTRWSGRKLGTLLFFQIQATVFLCVGKLDGGDWVTVTIALFTVFVGGVVVEKGHDTQTTRIYAKGEVKEKSPQIAD